MWRIYCGQMPLTGLYQTWEEARRHKARLQGLFASVTLSIMRV
jgi:hypothetical protein